MKTGTVVDHFCFGTTHMQVVTGVADELWSMKATKGK